MYFCAENIPLYLHFLPIISIMQKSFEGLTKTILVTLILLIPAIAFGKPVAIGKLKYNINTEAKTARCAGLAEDATKAYNLVIPNTVKYNNVTCKVIAVEKEAFAGDGYLRKVTLSDYTETVGSYAFSQCDNISVVSLGKKLRILGKEAFSHTGLNGTFTSISFPATLEIIREGVFTDCRFLSSVTFQGSKVTEIGEEAFWNCIALKSIVLPGSLKSVGTDAFSNCDSLYEVTFQSGNGNTVIATKCFDNVKSLTLLNFQGPGVARICEDAFIGCNIQWLALPTSLHTIESGAFIGNNLTILELPEGLKYIGDMAFLNQYGNGLKQLTIPSTVTHIGSKAFFSIGQLNYVKCNATVPPAAGEDVFTSNITGRSMLYVPEGSVEKYKAAPVWRDFRYINGKDAGVDDILADDADKDAEEIWYDMSGHEVSAENAMPGIYIVRKGSSVEKRIVR